jgi:hypothetical protein
MSLLRKPKGKESRGEWLVIAARLYCICGKKHPASRITPFDIAILLPDFVGFQHATVETLQIAPPV